MAGVKGGELNVATVSNRELPTRKKLLPTNTDWYWRVLTRVLSLHYSVSVLHP